MLIFQTFTIIKNTNNKICRNLYSTKFAATLQYYYNNAKTLQCCCNIIRIIYAV